MQNGSRTLSDRPYSKSRGRQVRGVVLRVRKADAERSRIRETHKRLWLRNEDSQEGKIMGPMIVKIVVVVGLSATVILEIAFAVWDYRRRKK